MSILLAEYSVLVCLVIGEPILASETWLTGDMFEWIEMHDSDFFG